MLLMSIYASVVTFFLHSSPEALVKPAEAALIPLVFVNDALTTEPDKAGVKVHESVKSLQLKCEQSSKMGFKVLHPTGSYGGTVKRERYEG